MNRRAQGRRPWRWCAIASMRNTPGVPTARPPTTASLNAMGWPLCKNKVSRADCGAVSRPS